MKKLWSDEAWEHYTEIQRTNKRLLKKINDLIKSIEREGVLKGIGKPEPL